MVWAYQHMQGDYLSGMYLGKSAAEECCRKMSLGLTPLSAYTYQLKLMCSKGGTVSCLAAMGMEQHKINSQVGWVPESK